ncbi:histone-lysine N-methyltransferase SUVR3 [Olea europaea var. sylvestris]|uniref:histone-lysine N-methyltransferase SUVR3 n=1 Tax=Olea europaea var. sylvestris TaxID=158386 RepID=UPI000C1D6BC9|nr:histone-lysine N-methyltransferase SUVR3 [Olea europaea var. sylvestris]
MEEKCRRRNNNQHQSGGTEGALLRCADLVLPYLRPAELAAISSTCKTLNHISETITSRRTFDVSRGFEDIAVPSINPVVGDLELYPYFLYTPVQTLELNPEYQQSWGSDTDTGLNSRMTDPFLFRVEGADGCECVRCDSGDSSCTCLDSDESLLTRECGPSCRCEMECGNRVTQGGVSVKLKIVKDERKGWGLYAAESIPKGKFVCEYAGELLATKEARRRQQTYDELAPSGHLSPALLVVKEHLPSGNACMRINIDATRVGNVARFINHSCDGGNTSLVIVRSSGALLPRICLFASRGIQENEELMFSYGDVRLRSNGQQCFCGSSSCAGFMPSEQT